MQGGHALAVDLEYYSLILNVDYVDSIFIHYCEFLSGQRGEFSDFSGGILGKVLLAFERLDLFGRAAVEFVQEGTFVSERYKLQLREGLVLLVLIGLRRLLLGVSNLRDLFLELLLLLLRV